MRLYHQLHILILDLDDRRQWELTAALRKLGIHSILSARTLTEVNSLLTEYPVDLIFLGDQLPKMPITETIQTLRSSPRSEKIPLIHYTQTRNVKGARDQFTSGLSMVVWHVEEEYELDRALQRALHIDLSSQLISLARHCDFFSGFSLEELREILRIGTPCRYEAGEVVIRRGDPADSLFVLLKGRIETVLPRPAGGEVVAHVPEGQSFGEMGILDGPSRSGYCVAAEEAIVLEIDAKVLLHQHNPIQAKILAKIATLLAGRLRTINEKIHPSREANSGEELAFGPLFLEHYQVAVRQIHLRRHSLSQRIPEKIKHNLQKEVCDFLRTDQLHRRWESDAFFPPGDRLRGPIHLVVGALQGNLWYQQIFPDLPFTNRVVARPDGGSKGTFLRSLDLVHRYLAGSCPQETLQEDLTGSLEHTRVDVTKNTLFLTFDGIEGRMTHAFREAFPEAQIVAVVAGKERLTSCAEASRWVDQTDSGFRTGEALFFPSLASYFPSRPTADASSLFATIDLIAELGSAQQSLVAKEWVEWAPT